MHRLCHRSTAGGDLLATADRLEMRLPAEEKGLPALAAQLVGVKLSQFVLAPALKRARKGIAESERVTTTSKGYNSPHRARQAAEADQGPARRHAGLRGGWHPVALMVGVLEKAVHHRATFDSGENRPPIATAGERLQRALLPTPGDGLATAFEFFTGSEWVQPATGTDTSDRGQVPGSAML